MKLIESLKSFFRTFVCADDFPEDKAEDESVYFGHSETRPKAEIRMLEPCVREKKPYVPPSRRRPQDNTGSSGYDVCMKSMKKLYRQTDRIYGILSGLDI